MRRSISIPSIQALLNSTRPVSLILTEWIEVKCRRHCADLKSQFTRYFFAFRQRLRYSRVIRDHRCQPQAFTARYGPEPHVVGPFTGDLTIQASVSFLSVRITKRLDFTYDDAWYPARWNWTDLVVYDETVPPAAFSTPIGVWPTSADRPRRGTPFVTTPPASDVGPTSPNHAEASVNGQTAVLSLSSAGSLSRTNLAATSPDCHRKRRYRTEPSLYSYRAEGPPAAPLRGRRCVVHHLEPSAACAAKRFHFACRLRLRCSVPIRSRRDQLTIVSVTQGGPSVSTDGLILYRRRIIGRFFAYNR